MKGETYVWQCKRCGRIGMHKFYEHAPNKNSMKMCDGEVVKIKFKNAW